MHRRFAWSFAILSLPVVTACGGTSDSDDAAEAGTSSGDSTVTSTEDDDVGPAPDGSDDPGDDDGGTTAPAGGSSSSGASATGDDTDGSTTSTSSDGCGADPTGIAQTLEVDGESRTFIVSLPDGYDPITPYPLVFAWHGAGGDGALAKLYFGIEEASEGAAVFVYPDGLDVDGSTGWDLMPTGRDVAFFDALVEHLTTNLCIDDTRVFSTGHSFGGFMSNTLGCHRGDVLAAIAPVAGGGPYFGACTGEVAVWLTHGEADAVVTFDTGVASRDHWSAANACAATTTPVPPEPCEAYDGCGEPVVWCAHPGGHEWPAFAAAAIWSFFAG